MTKNTKVNKIEHKGVLPSPSETKAVQFMDGLPKNVAHLLKYASINLQAGCPANGARTDLRIYGKKSPVQVEVVFEEITNSRKFRNLFFTVRYFSKVPRYAPASASEFKMPWLDRPGLNDDITLGQRIAGSYAMDAAQEEGFVPIGYDRTSPTAKTAEQKKREGFTITLYSKKSKDYPYLQLSWDKCVEV